MPEKSSFQIHDRGGTKAAIGRFVHIYAFKNIGEGNGWQPAIFGWPSLAKASISEVNEFISELREGREIADEWNKLHNVTDVPSHSQ